MKKNKQIKRSSTMLCDDLDFVLHEEYRTLRTNIQFSLSDEASYHCIGITSSIKGEAKTTTAINLAYVLAENEKNVCLLEADMRLPTIGKKLHLSHHIGLSEYLTGQASANDVLEQVTFKKCHFHCIQAGTLPPNPAELLSSPRMEKLLKALGDVFAYIIIDLPPINMVSDASVLGQQLDGIVMVVAQPYCTKRILRESIKQLSMARIKVLGFVRTFCTNHGFGYTKYGKHGYKYRYKYRNSGYENTTHQGRYT